MGLAVGTGMDQQSTRTLLTQLAEDLRWLEQHCQGRRDQSTQAAHLYLTGALIRNCVGPYLDDHAPPPLHIAVIGGAGAGKSTVVNFLLGVAIAESNPQAGFTRHPIAYAGEDGPLRWPAHVGFLGPLERLTDQSSSSLDRDVYQLRRVGRDALAGDLLRDFVVWDCPDMTTWAATGYVGRLLEVAGLADLIVYVASDERYNDEVPTQFLQQMIMAGKPVVVCLMKMKEEEAFAVLAHFQTEVLQRLTREAVACLAIPFLTLDQLASLGGQAARYRIPLLNQVAALGSQVHAARGRAVRGALNYVVKNQDRLLNSVRQDVLALEQWQETVRSGQREFMNRYRREYLTGEKFRGFDQALVRLLELLELPGVGRILSNTLWIVRTPYRLLGSWLGKALKRPESQAPSEEAVLRASMVAWLDQLRKEALCREEAHPLWAHVENSFKSGLAGQANQQFDEACKSFHQNLQQEIDRTARAIYSELEKNPIRLNILRGSKFALDAAGIAGAIALGHTFVQDAVLAVVSTWVTQQLVELLGAQYVESQREQARTRQELLVSEQVAGPLASWLGQWPATGGSEFERLQAALARIPPAVRELQNLVETKLSAAK